MARLNKLLQLIPGHHQDGTWPPYRAITEAFLEDGWQVMFPEAYRERAPITFRQWHHPKIDPSALLTLDGAWYVLGVDKIHACATEAMGNARRNTRFDQVAVLGHSLHAHVAYAVASERLRSENSTVIALTPVADLAKQRDAKLRHIGIPTVDDERFIDGGAAVHRDEYTGERVAMVYTRDGFWNDYERRITEQAVHRAVASWRGPSIIVTGVRDAAIDAGDIITYVEASARNPIIVDYPGGHRPTVDEARDLATRLVDMLR